MQPIITYTSSHPWTLVILGLALIAIGIYYFWKSIQTTCDGQEFVAKDMIEFGKPEGCPDAFERFERAFEIHCSNAFIENLREYHAAAVRAQQAAVRTAEANLAKFHRDMRGRMTVESKRVMDEYKLEIRFMLGRLDKLKSNFTFSPLLHPVGLAAQQV